ncbi:flippase-like domain-containing protein [Acidobacteria bacterium AH-259-A15]|nr:flippase-like domain-containing protein [Acidobacteria bacterium AH-259-A15]
MGGADIWSQFKHWRLLPLVGAMVATLGITGATVVRWRTILNTLSGSQMTSWVDYFHYLIIGRALGFILPKDVADVGSRALWLSQLHGLPISHASASVVLDRLLDVFVSCLFLVATLPFWVGWIKAPVSIGLMGALAIILGLFLFFGYNSLVTGLSWLWDRRLRLVHAFPWPRKYRLDLPSMSDLDRGVLLRIYLFSLVKFVCTSARLFLFSLALGLPISWTLILLGTPVGQFAYMFAFTPGGLGIFEAGWFAILRLGGVETEDAAAFVVGQRILTLVLIGILALLSQILYMLRRYLLWPVQEPVDFTSNRGSRSANL